MLIPEHACLRVTDGACWKLIDFGLARCILDEEGNIAPARNDAQFRGTRSYASVNACRDEVICLGGRATDP